MDVTSGELVEELNYEMTKLVMPVTAYVGIETVLGFFGNILVIYVFSRRYHVCNFRYFVLCMALLDFTSCLTTMPGEILTQTHWYTYEWNYICKVKSFFNMFTATGVAFSLLTIAVDRYRKICRPFGWQIKPKVAIGLCGIIYFIAFCCGVPGFIFWGIQTNVKVYKNRTITISKCEVDGAFKGSSHPTNYTSGLSVVFSTCMFCMFVLYVFIARKLLQDKRKYNATTTKTTTFINSTYLAGDSSDTLESSTKQESSDSKSKQQKANKNVSQVMNNENVSLDKDLTSKENNKSDDMSSENIPKKRKHKPKRHKSLNRHEKLARVRRKTLIMFVLTVVFIITMILYITLASLIANDILDTLNETQKTVFFFFFRFYFINHVINPLIYGIMDPHFRRVLMARCATTDLSRSHT